MRWTRMLLLMVVATFAITGPAAAATFNVNTTDDVASDCVTTCSIRGAIAAANANVDEDTIVIPAGQYSLTQTTALRITTPVTVTGAGANATTITANPSVEIRALEIANATASIADLWLQGGQALFGINGPHGGSLMAQTSTVTLTRVRVSGGSALSGGGIANRNGQMTIDQSLISQNFATQGGGDGGGIINFGGDGGNPASLTIRNSTIAFNTARLAGGLISYGSAQNTVSTTGVTIAQNHAGDRGTGAVQIGEGTWSSQLTLIADNFHEQTSSNCSGTKAVSSGGNLETSDGECGFTEQDDRRILDARLSTVLENNAPGTTPTMALLPGSPAIDIRTTSCDGVDQRGVLRPKGAGCDAGAFEATYWVAVTSGPEGGTRNATPAFTFGSTEGANGYRCRIKGRDTDFSPCFSPYTVTPALPDGPYTFQVEALLDGQGQAIAERGFTVDTQAPPAPVVTTPANDSFVRDTAVTFAGTAEPNTSIRILENGVEIDSANVDDTGAWSLVSNLPAGQHDLNVVAADAAGDSAPTPVRVTVDLVQPETAIDSHPPEITNRADVTFTYGANEPGTTFTCRIAQLQADEVPCPATGVTYTGLATGEYTFQVRAIDRAGNEDDSPEVFFFRIDTNLIAAPTVSEPATEAGAATFTFAAGEAERTLTCRLEGPGRDAAFTSCASPARYEGLTAGDYRFTVRSSDAAGNSADAPARTFTIAPPAVAAQQTPTPTASPTPTPSPTATPTPQPQVDESVVVRPTQGKVLIKLPGTDRFVELKSIDDVPLGAEIDTRNGRVQLRFETEDGKVQTATFYGGLFIVKQVGKLLDVKLSEPLAACPKRGKAAAAQTKKAKKRKLWGDGKGAFRTSGKYSAATVRGTKWYVEDSCAGTLTRVLNGVVQVTHGKKKVLLRAGKRYLAKPRR